MVKNEPQDPLPLGHNPVTPAYLPLSYPTPAPQVPYQTPNVSQPSTSALFVKPEPAGEPLLNSPPKPTIMTQLSPQVPVKPEQKHDVKHEVNLPLLPKESYTTYGSVDEIPYTPENALAEGVRMAKTIGSYLNQIDLGSQLRKDVWLREVERLAQRAPESYLGFELNGAVSSLKNQGTPHTMIAVCGATGAGKSSLLNAVLDGLFQELILCSPDVNVCLFPQITSCQLVGCEVGLSAYRPDPSDIIQKTPACTAVVTEIGYHDKNTIAAEVEFLELSEWKAELEILVYDLVDEEGKLKRLSDLRSDSGVAWHKVRIQRSLGSSNTRLRRNKCGQTSCSA